jgi:anti-sigma factor RsiW
MVFRSPRLVERDTATGRPAVFDQGQTETTTMTDREILVTEDELHAYVDNELPAERRSDVEAWLAAHHDDAERVQSWRAMAEALHARYDSVADEAVPKRLELDRLVRHWWRSSPAAASAGSRAAWSPRPRHFRI